MANIKRFRPGEDDVDPKRAPNEQRALPGISPTSPITKDGRWKPPRLNALFFARLCEQHGIPRPVHQWAGHTSRKFSYDFAWPAQRIVLEVDGGIVPDHKGRRGAHGTVAGIRHDIEKGNATQIDGLMFLRVEYNDYMNLETLAMLKRAHEARAAGK